MMSDRFDQVVAKLQHSDVHVRIAAAQMLRKCTAPSAVIVRGLASALGDSESQARMEIALTLSQFGASAREAVGALSLCLRDDDVGVRVFAADALGMIGPDAVDAIPALVAALGDDGVYHSMYPMWVGAQAAEALARIGLAAVPPLTELLKDPQVKLRLVAVRQLGAIGSQWNPQIGSTEAANRPIQARSDDEPAALGGSVVRLAIESLRETLSDSDVRVRLWSAWALLRFGKEPCPQIIEVLADSLNKSRAEHGLAAELLIDIGAPCIPAMLQRFDYETYPSGWTPARILGRMGEAAHSAVARLVELLGHKSADVRRQAAEVLGQIGPRAGSAASELAGCLSDERLVRRAALRSLRRIAPDQDWEAN